MKYSNPLGLESARMRIASSDAICMECGNTLRHEQEIASIQCE